MRNNTGIIALLIQYFRNGCAVVARNFTFLLCRIKVVIFQLITKMPNAKPTIAVLSEVILPKYSGARKRELAPNVNIKSPETVAISIYQNIERDRKYFLSILNKWKAKQKADKPVLYIINTSGGGERSAVFTMNALQRLDSLFHGDLMNSTVLIKGASGGMLGAA